MRNQVGGVTFPKFDVNCSILFTDLPLLERPAAAKQAGFDAVEFWWPFGDDPTPGDKEIDAFVHAIHDAGVELVGLNFIDLIPAGDAASSPFRARSPGSATISTWPSASPRRPAAVR